MSTRQQERNAIRQPVEERVRQALQKAAPAQATIRVEVHDHDGIRGGVIWVELISPLVGDELRQVQVQLSALAKASIPAHHPLATWTMTFQLSGKQVAMTNWFEA